MYRLTFHDISTRPVRVSATRAHTITVVPQGTIVHGAEDPVHEGLHSRDDWRIYIDGGQTVAFTLSAN